MTASELARLEAVARRSLVFASALLALLFDLLPLPNAAPYAVAPLSTLAVLYHWTVHRPDLIGPGAAFLLGLLRDLAGGLPAGLHALVFLLVPAFLRKVPRGSLQRSLPMCWLFLLPIVIAAGAVRWSLAALLWWQPAPARPFVLEALLTWAFYPVIALLLAPVGRLLPKAARAPGS